MPAHIAVVGDIMVDQNIVSGSARESNEVEGVCILEGPYDTVLTPGGAGNVCRYAQFLGANTTLIGVTGDSHSAIRVLQILNNHGIHCIPTVVPDVPPIVKTRFTWRGEQLLRVDEEPPREALISHARSLCKTIEQLPETITAIAVSDYGKGSINETVVQCVVAFAAARGIPVIVDPKSTMYNAYSGVTVLKPNAKEARQLSGYDSLSQAGNALRSRIRSNVLITNGQYGMKLFSWPLATEEEIPTQPIKDPDVVGAGDSVLATLAVALSERLSLRAAAVRACEYSSRVVSIKDPSKEMKEQHGGDSVVSPHTGVKKE
jgi:rfaE bifunctional protein kinase chain/domain